MLFSFNSLFLGGPDTSIHPSHRTHRRHPLIILRLRPFYTQDQVIVTMTV